MPIREPREGESLREAGARGGFLDTGNAEPEVDSSKARDAAGQFNDLPMFVEQFDFDETTKQRIVSMVLLDEDQDLRASKPFLDKISEIISMYEQERDPKAAPFQGASNLTVGDIPIAVENMHPRLFGAIKTSDLGNFTAQNEPAMRNLRNVSSLMQWAFKVDMPDTIDKLDEHVHSTNMFGTQPVWIRWDKQRNAYWGLENQDPDDEDSPDVLRRKVEIIERARFDNLNLEDFIVPVWEGDDLQQMSHVIRGYYLTVTEIRELIRRGIFRDPGEQALEASIDELIKKDSGEELERLRASGFNMPEIRERKRIRMLEWHGGFDAEGEGFRSECVFTVAKELNLYLSGRYQPFPDGKRPFEVSRLVPRKNFFYGIGVPELIRQLAKERDAIHNQRIDAGAVSIIPFGFYRAASGFQPDKITLQPGSWIPLDDVERDVQFAQFSNPATVLASEESMTQAQIEKLSIAGSFQLGRESEIFKSRATATGTNLIVGQGNIRFNLLAERMKRGVARILNRVLALYQAFLPPDTAERVIGEDGARVFPRGVTRREIQGKFTAYLTGDSETSNISVDRQIKTFTYQALIENPIVQRSPSRLWEVTAELLRSFKLDVVRFLGPKPADSRDAIEQVERMINEIKQGLAPSLDEAGDLIGIISGLSSFKNTDDFASLDVPKQNLVDETINEARGKLAKRIQNLVERSARQGGGGQNETFLGEQEVPGGGPAPTSPFESGEGGGNGRAGGQNAQ